MPAVLRLPEHAVPGPAEAFVVSGNLAARVGDVVRIDAGDVVATRLLRRWLQTLQRDPALAVEAGETLGRLTAWSEAHESTYAAVVGARLDDQTTETRGQVRQYLEELQEAQHVRRATAAQPGQPACWLLTFILFVFLVPAGLVALGFWPCCPGGWLAVLCSGRSPDGSSRRSAPTRPRTAGGRARRTGAGRCCRRCRPPS